MELACDRRPNQCCDVCGRIVTRRQLRTAYHEWTNSDEQVPRPRMFQRGGCRSMSSAQSTTSACAESSMQGIRSRRTKLYHDRATVAPAMWCIISSGGSGVFRSSVCHAAHRHAEGLQSERRPGARAGIHPAATHTCCSRGLGLRKNDAASVERMQPQQWFPPSQFSHRFSSTPMPQICGQG